MYFRNKIYYSIVMSVLFSLVAVIPAFAADEVYLGDPILFEIDYQDGNCSGFGSEILKTKVNFVTQDKMMAFVIQRVTPRLASQISPRGEWWASALWSDNYEYTVWCKGYYSEVGTGCDNFDNYLASRYSWGSSHIHKNNGNQYVDADSSLWIGLKLRDWACAYNEEDFNFIPVYWGEEPLPTSTPTVTPSPTLTPTITPIPGLPLNLEASSVVGSVVFTLSSLGGLLAFLIGGWFAIRIISKLMRL